MWASMMFFPLFTTCNLFLKRMNSASYPGRYFSCGEGSRESLKMQRHMGRLSMTPCTATTAENPKERLGMRQVWCGNGLTDHALLQATGWTFAYLHVEKLGKTPKFRSSVHTNLDIFETVHFTTRICVDEALNQYEEWFKKMRFQWVDSLVLCRRKANSCNIYVWFC